MVQKSLGRPLGFDPDEALGVVLEVFWRRGYDATTMPDLEAATGLARSSIYNRFGDKRGIFLAALAEYARVVGDELTRPLEHGTAGLDDLAAFFDLLERHARDRDAPSGCLVVNHLVARGGEDEEADRILGAYIDRLRSGIADALRRAAASGETSADEIEIETRADVVLTVVLGISAACRARDGYDLPLLSSARALITGWRR